MFIGSFPWQGGGDSMFIESFPWQGGGGLFLNVNVVVMKVIVLVPARLRLILIDYYGHTFGQMYQRLGELPLYLSRSYEGESFMTMKEGYFKTEAISPVVEEVTLWELL